MSEYYYTALFNYFLLLSLSKTFIFLAYSLYKPFLYAIFNEGHLYLKSVRKIRIRMFLGIPDPDPDPSINKQKTKKNLNFYYFVISFLTFVFEDWCIVYVPSKSNKQKNFEKTYFLLASCQPMTKKQVRIRSVVWIRESGSQSVPKCHGSRAPALKYETLPHFYAEWTLSEQRIQPSHALNPTL